MPAAPTHPNSFHALRLFAATMVVYSHGYELGGSGSDPLTGFTNGTSVGAIGVYMFFAMSGWLVTQSFASDPHVGRFLARRLLRIMPAFVVTILATALVLGPLVSAFPPAEYFAHPATRSYLHGLLVFPVQHALPGVFAENPFANSVNGSLWTLGPELFCYLLVALLGAFALLGRNGAAACLVSALAGYYVLRTSTQPPTLLYMNVKLLLELSVFFASGALLWFHRGRLAFSPLALPVLAAAMVVFGRDGLAPWILMALLPYTTVSLGLADSRTAAFFERAGDWSYGAYLWAFPIQQTTIWLFPAMPLAAYIAVAVVLAWAAGAASWHAIEKHALRFKPVSRSFAVPQPAR